MGNQISKQLNKLENLSQNTGEQRADKNMFFFLI